MHREVVGEAEHAFGNLFHRLHYFAQKLQGQGVEGATALEATITDLEDLLRLLLDYTSPLAVEVRELGAAAVLGSFGAAWGRPVASSSEDIGEQIVLADSGHLSEAFRLMKQGLGDGEEGSAAPVARLEAGEGVRWLRIEGLELGRSGIARGRGLVVWALAQKLIEAQGGILSGEGEEGGVRWSVRLPLPSE